MIRTSIGIGLTSIPKCNPIHPKIMIGAQLGPIHLDASMGNQFHPEIVRPNPQVQEQKEDHYKNLLALANTLEALIESATESKEIEIWKQQLAKLKGFDI